MTYSIPEMSPAKPRIWNAQNFMRQVDIVRRYGTPGFAVRTLLETKGLTKAWFFGAQPDLVAADAAGQRGQRPPQQ